MGGVQDVIGNRDPTSRRSQGPGSIKQDGGNCPRRGVSSRQQFHGCGDNHPYNRFGQRLFAVRFPCRSPATVPRCSRATITPIPAGIWTPRRPINIATPALYFRPTATSFGSWCPSTRIWPITPGTQDPRNRCMGADQVLSDVVSELEVGIGGRGSQGQLPACTRVWWQIYQPRTPAYPDCCCRAGVNRLPANSAHRCSQRRGSGGQAFFYAGA